MVPLGLGRNEERQARTDEPAVLRFWFPAGLRVA